MIKDDSAHRTKKMSAAGLARLLGVSPAAVSYGLHGRDGVSDELRRKILAAAYEHGITVPNNEVAERRTAVLGLILADVSNPFYTEMAVSVTDVARSKGFEVFLSHTKDERDSVLAAADAMVKAGVQGLLLTALQSGDGELSRRLRVAKVPFVQISRRMERVDADFVGLDEIAAGASIMNHVLDHGHRRVAIVAGPATSSASRTRAHGFRSALSERGLELPRHWNLTGGLNESDGARAARFLLDQRDLPAAVVCGSDAIALGVVSTFATRGLRVPEDIAVTGFDGLTNARTHLVDLTTVVQPRTLMASEALAMIADRSNGCTAPSRTAICPHQIYIGKSCGCSPRMENIG